MKRSVSRALICFIGSTSIPFLLASVYLYLSRNIAKTAVSANFDPAQLDILMLLLCLAVGSLFISFYPVSIVKRFLIGVFYIPIIGLLIGLYSITFVCLAFSHCL